MAWQLTLDVVVLTIGTCIAFLSVALVWHRRTIPGSTAFILLMLAVAEWTFTRMLEAAAVQMEAKIFWAKWEYLGIVSVPPLWLLFALYYGHRRAWWSARQLALLWVVPIVTVIMAATNEWHGLLWPHIAPATPTPGANLVYNHGLWFWIAVVYNYVLLLLGSLTLVWSVVRSLAIYRRQIIALLVGAAIPWVGNLIYLAGLSPVPGLDLTPFAFSLTGLLYAQVVFGFQLFELAPVARDLLVESMADGVLVIDAHNRIVDVNPTAARMIGATPDQLVGQKVTAALTPWAELIEKYSDLRNMRREVPIADTTLDVSISALHDDQGHFIGRLVVFRDITDRKQAEAELEALYRTAEHARSQTRAILDTTSDVMILVSAEGQILTVNRQFTETFAIAASEIVGRQWAELPGTHTQRLTAFSGFHDMVVAGAADTQRQFSGTLVQERPQRRELALFSAPVWSEGHEYLGRLSVLRDVTHERKVDRMKSDLISLVSHELKTPLTAVKGYTELVAEGIMGEINAEQVRCLNMVTKSTNQLITLINDFLDLSRIESGHIEIQPAELNIDDMLMDVFALLKPQIQAKGQTLQLEHTPNLSIWGDPDRLRQVMTNLLSNAHKYTPTGGHITITAHPQDDHWACIAVQDTGVGMTPEEQAKLFTRFFRAQNQTTRDVVGTGLGLVITQTLVHKHGGEIHVTSAPGQGSTFSFTLPRTYTALPPSLTTAIRDPA